LSASTVGKELLSRLITGLLAHTQPKLLPTEKTGTCNNQQCN
jgi:hypothetical protein